ncbi:uncharacterized protein [Oncorhynchus clarkii lewisi]|uniref:uncharacterized protein n=1 Tax=Oncorhynchus clarkii lewisi TaxID=490388 RepID=UPI0039B85BF1
MAITKNGLSVLVLLVTCSVLETREFIEISSLFSQGFNTEYNPHLSHVREKRAVLSNRWNYIIDVEVNVSDIKTIEQIKSAVNSTSLPLTINNSTEISAVDITTVCYPYGTGFQCRCEDQYRWSYNNCVTYGSCDDITGDTCGCINANPADGQYCQPYTKPVTLLEYFVEVEVNVNDLKAIDEPKNLLKNLSLPFALSSMINITDINITTVCFPNGTGFQCRCEDQYRWSCDQCVSYGKCDDITSDTCGCINAIPTDGQYCQSVLHQIPTVPPTLYEYMIEIELNTTDVTVIDQLRAILRNAIYPFASQMVLDSSADVRTSIVGHVTSVSLTGNVMTSHLTRVDVSMPFLQMDSTASLFSTKFASQMVLDSSADVRTSIVGHVTSVSLLGIVMTSHLTRVDVLMPFLQMDSTASLFSTKFASQMVLDSSADVRTSIVGHVTSVSLTGNVMTSHLTRVDVSMPFLQMDSTASLFSTKFASQMVLDSSADVRTSIVGHVTSVSLLGIVMTSHLTRVDVSMPFLQMDSTASLFSTKFASQMVLDSSADVRTSIVGHVTSVSLTGNVMTSHLTRVDVSMPFLQMDSTASLFSTKFASQMVLDSSADVRTSIVGHVTSVSLLGIVMTSHLTRVDVSMPFLQMDSTASLFSTKFASQMVLDSSADVRTSIVGHVTSVSLLGIVMTSHLTRVDVSMPFLQMDSTASLFSTKFASQMVLDSSADVRTSIVGHVTSVSLLGIVMTSHLTRVDVSMPFLQMDSTASLFSTKFASQMVLDSSADVRTSIVGHVTSVSLTGNVMTSHLTRVDVSMPFLQMDSTASLFSTKFASQMVLDSSADVRTSIVGHVTSVSLTGNVMTSHLTRVDVSMPFLQMDSTASLFSTKFASQMVLDSSADVRTSIVGHVTSVSLTGNVMTSHLTRVDVSMPFLQMDIPTVPPTLYEYMIEIEVNTTDVTVIDQLRAILRNAIYPVRINNLTQITGVNMSTVCFPNATGFQCRCEDQYRWSCDQCVSFGNCDDITSDTCGCINAIPTDGQYCQSVLHQICFPNGTGFQCRCEDQYRWSCDQCVSFGNCDDITSDTCGCINAIPPDGQYCQSVLHQICFPNGTGFQCRCEDQYRWSCDQCVSYGKCDDITSDMCGCINAIPPDGQYCQSVLHQICFPNGTGFQCRCEDQYRWSCDQCVSYGKCDDITSDTCGCINAIPPDGQYCQSVLHQIPTVPPTLYEYMIEIEVNTTDVTVIDQLRAILRNAIYPVRINNLTQITGVNMSTVCFPNGTGFQCRCEDQYRWSCDQCVSYGKCDDITSDTCGCINAIPPDGQYCQSVLHQICFPNATGFQCRCEDQYRWSCDQCVSFGNCDDITSDTCGCINAIPPDGQYCQSVLHQIPTVPPTLYEYMIEIELNTTDVTVIDQLRAILRNAIYPVRINNLIQITGVNMSTVCFPNATGFQCRCEDQYRWSCDQCVSFGNCDDITSDTCGCINAIPPDGQYCQSVHHQSSTVLSYKPTTIYTDGTMTLECGPPPDTVKMGTIKSVEWKRKGRVLTSTGRFTINTDDFASKKTTLGIKNVIADDKGEYECTLKSDEIYFYQMGQIDIKDAPIIQTKTEINTKCVPGNNQPLECCVQTPYKLMWKEGDVELLTNETPDNCIKYKYQIQNCDVSSKVVKLTCQVKDPTGYEKTTKLTIFVGAEICNNLEYGSGQEKDTSVAPCKKGEDGIKTAICKSGLWIPQTDTCVLTAIDELLTSSQDLKEATVEEFLTKLNNTAVDLKEKIVSSSATISTIVDILRIVASVSKNISQSEIKNILETVNVLVSDEAKESWVFLNADQNKNTSSSLLGSMEFFAGSLPTTSFNVTTKLIQLNQDTFDNSFSTNLNSSVLIEIPETNSKHLTITTLTFHTLRNVLPARNGSNQSANDNTINGVVVMVKLNGTTKNVSLSFDKFNKSLTFNPQCVFWNFSLFNSLGGWDDTGCKLKSNEKGRVTCHCNHLTSFSILMSTSIPKEIQDALDIITYVGVGISMGSLVICLIIEACVWKAMTRNNTSYMRHVSIVNIAVSLLIADIWFIIGASISKNTLENPGEDTRTPISACTAATFFIHFFYLALFFWMLISGLLLFYRTILVFSHMSKSTMLAIGFSVGYGAPLIIAVVTVAATAPSGGYIKENQACWLNWDKTMALLAFVIPALTIVVINFLILIVVLYKMLRRGVGDATQPDERNAVVVIARCLAILTPFFGLTWGLGVGTMIDPTNKGIHVVFALFNSLQGFFVLVFGTLLDGKIRSAIVGTFSSILPGSDRTRSTSGGAATSSTSALNFIRRRIRRNVYNVSEVANSSNSTGATESFINT